MLHLLCNVSSVQLVMSMCFSKVVCELLLSVAVTWMSAVISTAYFQVMKQTGEACRRIMIPWP